MTVTTAMMLAAVLAAAPSPKLRVVLLPPAADASPAEVALFDALGAHAQARPGLSSASFPALAPVSETDDDALAREIETTITAVQAAYRRLDTEDAARRLNTLENARVSQLGCPERIALAAKISFWLGVVYAANRATGRASERFSAVLSSDPAYPIDAAYFPPQTVALFEKIRKGLAAAPTGGLSISGEADGAEVFLDGKPVGRTPVTLNAPAGDHFVCVRRPGWQDWAARLKLTAGKVETQRIFLQKAGPADLAQQVARLFEGRPPTLADPAQVEALAAALGVDVVVATRGGDAVTWRVAADSAQLHESVVVDPDAAVEARAQEALAAIERTLGAAPVVASAPPARPLFGLELAVQGGAGLTLTRGGTIGARIGFSFFVRPSLDLGVHVAFARGLGVVPLVDGSQPQRPVLAAAQDAFEIPVALAVRWTLIGTQRLRFFLGVGPALRVLLCSPALPITTQPPGPVVELASAPPLMFILVGPHLGAGAVIAITPEVGIFAGVEYGLEFQTGRTGVPATLKNREKPPVTLGNAILSADPLYNLVTVDLGVQWRF